MLKIGTPLPHVTGLRTDGSPFDFGQKLAGPLVIFFYPKAFTPGCTKEACSVRDNHESLIGVGGATLVGVSRDQPARNKQFKDEYQLPFELISDPSGVVAKGFGVQLFGGLVPVTQRATYVADSAGIVRAALSNMFDPERHVAEARAALEALAKH